MLGKKEIGTLVKVSTGEVVYDVVQRVKSGRIYFSGHDGRGRRVIIDSAAMPQYARGIVVGHRWESVDNYSHEIITATQRPDGRSAKVTVEITKLESGDDPHWRQVGVGMQHTEQGTWQGIVVQKDTARRPPPAEEVE